MKFQRNDISHWVLTLLALGFTQASSAASLDGLKFRYLEARKGCFDRDGNPGLNSNHLGECGDLRGRNLSSKTLSSVEKPAQFMGADFTGADLGYTVLTAADLRGARFEKITIQSTHLNLADLRGAVFTNIGQSRWGSAWALDLSFSDLSGASFEKVRLNECSFWASQLSTTNFGSQVEFQGCDFYATQMNGANLSGIQATRSRFNGTQAVDARFDGARLEGSVFGGYSDFTRASFEGAVLGDSKLERSKFIAANFKGTRFSLGKGTWKTKSEITRVNLSQATFNSKTELPFDFHQAIREGMVFDSNE